MLTGAKVPGIVIGFTADVQVSKTIDPDHVFQVLVDHTNAEDAGGAVLFAAARFAAARFR